MSTKCPGRDQRLRQLSPTLNRCHNTRQISKWRYTRRLRRRKCSWTGFGFGFLIVGSVSAWLKYPWSEKRLQFYPDKTQNTCLKIQNCLLWQSECAAWSLGTQIWCLCGCLCVYTVPSWFFSPLNVNVTFNVCKCLVNDYLHFCSVVLESVFSVQTVME